MAQVDFAVAFIVIFIMISYAVFFVSNTMSKDFNHFNVREIERSADSLSNQLFYTMDNKSLISNFKKMQILFEEVGSYPHTENLVISITPLVDKIHVYNVTMDEIPSSYAGGNISFDMSFSSNQKNYVNIFYIGEATDVSYISDNNITVKILYEEQVDVLSQDKCDALKSLSYDDAKNVFGNENSFRVDNYCIYGEMPPLDANIIINRIPMLVENQDGKLFTGQVTLKVW